MTFPHTVGKKVSPSNPQNLDVMPRVFYVSSQSEVVSPLPKSSPSPERPTISAPPAETEYNSFRLCEIGSDIIEAEKEMSYKVLDSPPSTSPDPPLGIPLRSRPVFTHTSTTANTQPSPPQIHSRAFTTRPPVSIHNPARIRPFPSTRPS